MKKILVLIVLLFVSISLYAQKPLMKIYDIDGKEKHYNIEDISEMNFVNTNMLYKMVVYKKDGLINTFLLANIKSIEFADTNKLKINLPKSTQYLFIAEIDSIVIFGNDCSEVTIGNQTWTCKNLDVDHYRNGDPIPEVKDSAEWANLKTGAWCYYNNDPSLGAIYGKLYNWYAVNDPRGLAPEGWHIPRLGEWEILIDYLGGRSVAGRKLRSLGTKEEGDGLWSNYNGEATNETGFSAIPGGIRNNYSKFNSLNTDCLFWVFTEVEQNESPNYKIKSETGAISLNKYDKKYGFSVRCVQGLDSPAPILNSISPDSAFIGETITLNGANFCPTQRNSFVSFNDLKVQSSDYVSWSENEIKVKVPLDAVLGKVSVTVYGVRSNELDFLVKRHFDYGTVTDYDGNVYKTIKLGGNWWMESNLKVKHYRNGDPIPEVKDGTQWSNLTTGAWCDYNNDPAMETTYGALYNWFTVNDPRGLAPEGWHVANDAEWNAFIDSLGGKDIAGSKLKDVRNDYWVVPNKDATNKSGFSAKPAGQRGYKGAFNYLGYFSYWWAYQEYDSNMARLKRLYYDCGWTGSYDYYKYYGYSVRCVKDVGTPALPKIISVTPKSVSVGEVATIKGNNFGSTQGTNFISFNSSRIKQDYSQSWSDTVINVIIPKGAVSCPVSVTINGIKSNEDYLNIDNNTKAPIISSISPDSLAYEVDATVVSIKGQHFGTYRENDFVLIDSKEPLAENYISWSDTEIKVKVLKVTAPGEICVSVNGIVSNKMKFKTYSNIEYSKVTDIDGNIYTSVKIGEQWWMAENLKVSRYLNGDTIPEVKDPKAWKLLKTGAWCYYNNDPAMGAIYGKLYNWFAVSDPRGIAPSGWHTSNALDWTILYQYLGKNYKSGGKLKSTGTKKDSTGLWASPNTYATNVTKFSALPAGYCDIDLKFTSLGSYARFWTSTVLDSKKAWYRFLNYDNGQLDTLSGDNRFGFSVRCIKNPEMPPPIISILTDSVTGGETFSITGKNFGNTQGTSYVAVDKVQFQQSDYISWSSTEIVIKAPMNYFHGKLSVNVQAQKSNVLDFTICYPLEFDTVTDIDGNVYKTVKIGNQWWMAENLKVGHLRNGDKIEEEKDTLKWYYRETPIWCNYENDIELGAVYGKLYNWYAISDSRGIAPKGWHIPTEADWTILADFLGGANVAGGKLKSTGTAIDGNGLWDKPNTLATNERGFTALPGGLLDNQHTFSSLKSMAYFWSYNYNQAKCWYVWTRWANLYNADATRSDGFSIRCVKD